jgi:hypothetical protein
MQPVMEEANKNMDEKILKQNSRQLRELAV